MLLAVGEAVNNAITHGSASRQDPTVTIESLREPDVLLFCVSDSGRWTRDSVQSRRAGRGGLGLSIIHDLTRDVDIRRNRLGTNVIMRSVASSARVSKLPSMGMPSV